MQHLRIEDTRRWAKSMPQSLTPPIQRAPTLVILPFSPGGAMLLTRGHRSYHQHERQRTTLAPTASDSCSRRPARSPLPARSSWSSSWSRLTFATEPLMMGVSSSETPLFFFFFFAACVHSPRRRCHSLLLLLPLLPRRQERALPPLADLVVVFFHSLFLFFFQALCMQLACSLLWPRRANERARESGRVSLF